MHLQADRLDYHQWHPLINTRQRCGGAAQITVGRCNPNVVRLLAIKARLTWANAARVALLRVGRDAGGAEIGQPGCIGAREASSPGTIREFNSLWIACPSVFTPSSHPASPDPTPLMIVTTTLRSQIAKALATGSIAYTTVLVFLTHYPKPQELLGEDLPPDKVLHFLAYGLLGLLVTATVAAFSRWSWETAARTAAALAAFAALDEITQPFFGRSAELLDWVWDLVGIAAGVAAVAAGRWLLRSPLGRSLRNSLPIDSQ